MAAGVESRPMCQWHPQWERQKILGMEPGNEQLYEYHTAKWQREKLERKKCLKCKAKELGWISAEDARIASCHPPRVRSRLDSNWGPLIRVSRRQDACFRGREAELPFPMFSRSWRWDSGLWMEASFSLASPT